MVPITKRGGGMTFLIRPGAPLCPAQLRARALGTWRDAAPLVQPRRDTFLEAAGASRPEQAELGGREMDLRAVPLCPLPRSPRSRRREA
jgi:hypothetical protein